MKALSPQARRDRELCNKSLYYLCKEVLGYRDMVPHVHGDICDFMTNPQYGRFRQACVPRSWFKTWVCTVGKAIWLSLPDEGELWKKIYPWKGPDARILIASNVVDNAEKMIHKIRSEWMNNSRLKAAYPELIPAFNKIRWSNSCAELKRPGKFTEGTYTAVGAGGSVISQHFDHITEDDLIYANKDDFTGKELMPNQEDIDKAIGWHKLTFSLLANPQTGTMDNVGTRWAPHDLIDYIRTNEKHYSCFQIDVTRDGVWPIPNNSFCVWPERYDRTTLRNIRASQGPHIFECFPVNTPILLSNWTTKSIEDIKLGDEVIGFTNGNSREQSRLLKSAVNLVESQIRDVVEVTLASGNVVRCTPDHPWFTGRNDSTHQEYLPAKVDRPLLQVYDCLRVPELNELLDWRYLAGLIDGEGACNHGSIAIAQSKDANPDVYEAIEAVLNRLQIPYKVCKVNPNDTHVLRNWVVRRGLGETFVLGGGREVKANILRFGRPAKAQRILKTIWGNPCRPIKREDRVVSIRPLGKQTVYAIGTTSGNYVAYGYATKNTQYLNRPRTAADVVFSVNYLNQHASLTEYPKSLNYRTYVDVSSWNDRKNLARSVVVTVGRCSRNHYWIARCDAGRYNPTEVIERMGAHAKQFNSKVLVEEYQYQKSLRFFAKKAMEDGTIAPFLVEAIPYEAQKNAKEMRIRGLEGYVKNGMLHILENMSDVVEEFEDYPYGATKDILDMLGYAVKYTPTSFTTAEGTYTDPFSLETILDGIKKDKDDEKSAFSDPLAEVDFGYNERYVT